MMLNYRDLPPAMVVQGEIRIPMSYEEFLTLDSEIRHTEWEDGEAIIFMPAAPRHQYLVTFLGTLLALFVEFFQRGRVLIAPVEMKVSPTSNAREPDILFVARDNLGIIDDKRLTGPADLIIEVVSPESIYRDRDRKFLEYQSAGVKEYWMIDPRPGIERAQFWVLNAMGEYDPVQPGEDDIYHSTVLAGFWLDTGWLWQEELPEPLSVFSQIAGFPPEMIAMLRQIAARGPLSGKA